MGGGLRPFRNNSLRSPLQIFLNPGMCGSSDAVPIELILWTSMRDLIESFTKIHDDQISLSGVAGQVLEEGKKLSVT